MTTDIPAKVDTPYAGARYADTPDTPDTPYAAVEPPRVQVDALEGATLLEFGSPGCGHCRRAQPLIAASLAAHPAVRHLKIADGSGRRLGRSFAVKLWPTLIFLHAGREVARLVRPQAREEIADALQKVDSRRVDSRRVDSLPLDSLPPEPPRA